MLKYIGGAKGVRYPGLPERDLQDDELVAFGGKDLLLGTGLYEAVDDKPEPTIAVKADEEKAIAEAFAAEDEADELADDAEDDKPDKPAKRAKKKK